MEQLRTEEIEKDIIVLKAIYGKQQGPLGLCPVREGSTGGMKGVPPYTEEEKRKLARVVTPETNRQITDGMIINRKDNPIDRIDWEWIKWNKEIAPDFESAQSSPQALFYVDDPDAETEKKATALEDKFKAQQLIFGSSAERQRDIARLMGNDLSTYSDQEVKVFLAEKADSKESKDVEKVLKAFQFYNAGNGKEMLFVYRLIDKRILHRDSDGNIRYGERTIGVSDEDAFNNIRKPENVTLMRKLYLDLQSQGAAKGLSNLIGEEEKEKKAKEEAEAQAKAAEAEAKMKAEMEAKIRAEIAAEAKAEKESKAKKADDKKADK